MILNYNITSSSVKNLFYDNISSHGFIDNIICDLHPLFGYFDNVKKYYWSYKSILIYPYFFYNIQNIIQQQNIIQNNIFFILSKQKPISYYIIIQLTNNLEIEISISKIKHDILKLKLHYPSNIINVFLPIQENDTFLTSSITSTLSNELNTINNCFLFTTFDWKDILQNNTFFVASNVFSPLFILCYKFNLPIVVISDLIPYRHHLKLFFADIFLRNLNNISSRINLFITHVLPFFELSDLTNLKTLQNPFFKFLIQQSINQVSIQYNNSNTIYIHENFNHEYANMLESITKSPFVLTSFIKKASIIVLSVDESVFMKSLIKIKTNNYILLFDINPMIISNNNDNFFRYSLIHNGHIKTLTYKQSFENFYLSQNICYNETGYILVLLDNYNNFQYSSKLSWIEKWKPIFNKLKTYQSYFKIKLHPNNEIVKYTLINTFNIDEKNIIYKDILLENLLSKNDIKFCVQKTGTSYIKCIQYGVLIFSLNDTVDYTKCIFCLDNDINSINKTIETYINSKTYVFQNYINNNIINQSELLNGRFFTLLYNYLI